MKREDYRKRKSEGIPFAMVTCYDFPLARLLDEVGIEMIFVGDSLGTNVLGYGDVREVTVADMRHHLRAVRRGVRKGDVVVDLPFGSYGTPSLAVDTAAGFSMDGADLIKLEGGMTVLPQVRALVDEGHRVIAHLGYQPQFHEEGEPIVCGRSEEEVSDLLETALAFDQAGAEMVLLECVTERVAGMVTGRLSIPTIGIGSGNRCDGQVLVLHDLLGINKVGYRFVRQYAALADEIKRAAAEFRDDVAERSFPGEGEWFNSPQGLVD
ncbi:MAG: 3-methyl-2-oxobutanoate hydroxymethyltransferase [Puniceicoccaceae bacterium]